MSRSCDLRLGDQATAVVHGTEVTGTVVLVNALYAGIRVGQSGVIMAGKHTELKSVRAPETAEEINEWLSRPLILCERCD